MTDQIITHEFRNQKFYFTPTPTAQALINEIFSDNYKVLEKGVEFRPGDVVLDLGACEGMFSIMMAKLFPMTRIIGLEPVPQTYFTFVRNIGLNGCTNIEPYNIGVGKPGQHTTTLHVAKNNANSGGSSSLFTFDPLGHDKVEVGLIDLDSAFDLYRIDRCRLMKIDIEGMEYDALYPSHILPRVDYLTAEYHQNAKLEYMSRRMDGLATWCARQVNLIHVDFCKMAE
jgi:FkbM family methyltransferase